MPIPYLVAINVAVYNLYMWIDEYRYFTEIVIPYLKAHWDEIDLVETTSGERDGHLTKAELESARDHARERGDDEAADILHELIMRYDVICSAYRQEKYRLRHSRDNYRYFSCRCIRLRAIARPGLSQTHGHS